MHLLPSSQSPLRLHNSDPDFVFYRFYRDAADNTTLADNGFGGEWAERGTRLVFEEADEPNEENIPAFMNLALYWYSQGMWRKSNMLRCKLSSPAFVTSPEPLPHQRTLSPVVIDHFYILERRLRRSRSDALILLYIHSSWSRMQVPI